MNGVTMVVMVVLVVVVVCKSLRSHTTSLLGTVKGNRSRGEGGGTRCEDNITEWTGLKLKHVVGV